MLTLSGTATLATYQTLLRSVAYSSSSDDPTATSGSRTITWSLTDANSDAAGPGTGTATTTVNITAVNDAPVLATGSTLNYTENGAAAAINTAITTADLDNTTLASGTVSITANFASGQDVLALTNVPATMGNITGSYNAGTGIMTLASAGSTATLAQWQAALRAVTYANSSDGPSTAVRTVSYTVNDGAASSNIVTSTVNITAVNDAPTVSAPASFTVTEDLAGNLLYTGTPFTDPDSASLTVTLSIADGTISASTGAGVTVGGSATARTFSGTVAALNSFFTTVGAITYTTALDNTTARTLTTLVSDGSLSASTNSTISITAVNDPPTVSAPATFTVTEDVAGNLLYAGTPFADADTASLTVTLSIADGTISASTGAGVTVGGSATARTFSGAVAALNSFFTTVGAITYTTALDNTTARTLTTLVSDGSLSASTNSTISITAVNDAPVYRYGRGELHRERRRGGDRLWRRGERRRCDQLQRRLGHRVAGRLPDRRPALDQQPGHRRRPDRRLRFQRQLQRHHHRHLCRGSAATLVITLNANATATAVQALMGQLRYF